MSDAVVVPDPDDLSPDPDDPGDLSDPELDDLESVEAALSEPEPEPEPEPDDASEVELSALDEELLSAVVVELLVDRESLR